MASLRIAEFQGNALTYIEGFGHGGQIADLDKMLTSLQALITVDGTSRRSAAFAEGVRVIRVETDAICALAYDGTATPTADANSVIRMVAGQTEYFGVKPGAKLAVISVS